MTITIKTSSQYTEEKKYIAHVVFCEFLGIDINLVFEDTKKTTIIFPNKHKLVISDVLFQTPADKWLALDSLPKQPLRLWIASSIIDEDVLVEKMIPVIYGELLTGDSWVDQEGSTIHLGLDVFGSIFFMLTRYEEIVRPAQDKHGRFPATASLAFQEGFLDRPIVNEYVEILWALMKRLCPSLKRKKRSFRFLLSHDVDRPYEYAFKNLREISRTMVGDIVFRHSPKAALNRFKTWRQVCRGDDVADPFFTFDWIMDQSEVHGCRSSFYFIPRSYGKKKYESPYDLNHQKICDLMQRIYRRGHEIGYHASYTSFGEPDCVKEEVNLLQKTCERLAIKRDDWGGRQHYLRWQSPTTWQSWEQASLSYDSTLAYAEYAGFRTGSCCEYSTFNILTKQQLKLKERPLIVMEGSIIDDAYMGLGLTEEAFERIKLLFERTKLFNGDFTVVWHNSSLISEKAKNMYVDMLRLNSAH
ncbi:MAG: polysaccharide deacetylase family protein [bacterium]|nr:polysaccharide deacetylase family protein [bacterium]